MYPALAVLEALKAGNRLTGLLWVGGEGGMEEDLVMREGISYRAIPAAGVHGVGARALPGNLAKLARGVIQSRRILREFQPDVLFFTGGFVAAPMALAGRRIPAGLYVPDIEPGLALKFLSNYSNVITVTADESRKYFSASTKLVTTGYPLRADLSVWSREKAIQHLGLDSKKRTLLITGGSKGARSINTAVLDHLGEILEVAQVIHLTGRLDWPMVDEAQRKLPPSLKADYHAMPYSHEMGACLAAADLVLSRAGASSLGEYPFYGLPAVLVPYPYAWRYQKVNADYLAGRNAAVILQDEILNARLVFVIKDILGNEKKRVAMCAAMKNLSRPDASRAIASQLVELAGERPL